MVFVCLLSSCTKENNDPENIKYSYEGEVLITGKVTFNSEDDDLTIAPGSVIRFAPGALLQSWGNVSIVGTESEPITLISEDQTEDHKILETWKDGKSMDIMHTYIVNGLITTHDTDCHFKDVTFSNTKTLEWNSAATRFWGGTILIEDCLMDWNRKGEGFLVHGIEDPVVRNCVFKKVNDAVEYLDCKDGEVSGCQFLSNSDDAIDLNNCDNTLLVDNVFYGTQNRGMEIGGEGFGNSINIKVRNNLFVDCKIAVNVKENSDAIVENITVIDTETGLEIINEEENGLSSHVTVTNSVFANTRWPSYTFESTINISNSMSDGDLHDGINIIKAPIEFADTANNDYTIISTDFPVGLDASTIGYHPK